MNNLSILFFDSIERAIILSSVLHNNVLPKNTSKEKYTSFLTNILEEGCCKYMNPQEKRLVIYVFPKNKTHLNSEIFLLQSNSPMVWFLLSVYLHARALTIALTLICPFLRTGTISRENISERDILIWQNSRHAKKVGNHLLANGRWICIVILMHLISDTRICCILHLSPRMSLLNAFATLCSR